MNRHTATNPCLVCGGWDGLPRGQGERCHGFRSGDWVNCSREDHAGPAKFHPKSETYGHKARGACPCGTKHAPADTHSNGNGFGAGVPQIDRVYDYHDAAGDLVFQCVRFRNPKSFRQRRPNGVGGWIWNLQGVERVLYRLPELLAADPAAVVFITEGEKDSDRLRALGLTATTGPMGAGKWRPEYPAFLKGRDVVILTDNDKVGREHGEHVARSAHPVARSVKAVALPDLPEHGDVSDWLDAGGTAEELRRLIDAAPPWTPSAPPTATEAGPDVAEKKPRKPPASAGLLALADDVELFHAPDGRAYAAVPVRGHVEILAVRSQAFKRWLARAYFVAEGGAPSGEAMRDALGVLEAKALYDGTRRDVFVRVGANADRSHFYLDLADEDWRVVEITADGWRVLARSPVPFRRASGVLPLPLPVRGGSIEALKKYLNLPDDQGDSWFLVVAWLTASLRPVGPYPVLVILGEQGSAKSTASRALRGTIDPHSASLRSAQRDERDLMIAANANWLVALDNLSKLSDWLSDAMCRLATGGGFATRALFTDDEEVFFSATRPLLLNGIDDVATRPDLLDRAVLLKLPTIPDEERREEAAILTAYQAEQGAILGALLDAVSAGQRRLPSVRPKKLPRMADFARWGEAVGQALGWGECAFLDAFTRNRASITESAAEGSLVATAIRGFMAERDEWEGLPAELLRELTAFVGDPVAKTRGWPTRPNRLTSELTRVAPVLRRLGVHFTRPPRVSRGNPVALSRTPPPKEAQNTSTCSTTSTRPVFQGPASVGTLEMAVETPQSTSTNTPSVTPLALTPNGDSGGSGASGGVLPLPVGGPEPWAEECEWTA